MCTLPLMPLGFVKQIDFAITNLAQPALTD